jgi:polysaccharide export outer membrane protein
MGLEKTPAQTAALTSTAAPTGDITEEYRIGPEDVLEITVLGEETLNKRALVDPDGWIAFPMVGQVLVAGSTPGELERELTDKLKEFVRDPVVSVALADAAGYRVYVVGRVEKPGQFLAGRRIDVLKAIALAGGLTPFADQDDIKIVRRGGASGDQVFPFNYAAIGRGNKLEQNIVLQSGDVVLVP